MSDTPVDAETRFRELMLAQPPARRLAMASRMFGTARALVRAGIMQVYGDQGPAEMRKYMFLRLYGHDFGESERAKILDYLTAG